jgi:hypothetical protein
MALAIKFSLVAQPVHFPHLKFQKQPAWSGLSCHSLTDTLNTETGGRVTFFITNSAINLFETKRPLVAY